jgi:uncharacterized membrane protein
MEITALDSYLFRWVHMLAGVAWIGLLYYFNFVQTEYFKVAEPGAKSSAISQLVPRALWWFRFGALFTFLSGLALAAYLGVATNYYIAVGMLLGTLMFLNVWLIIWPNQKIVIESNTEVIEGRPALAEAPGAQGKAGLASRTNTLFSLPMLFFMGASGHLGGAGSIPMSAQTDMGVSDLGLAVAIIIVLGLEVNAIKGKLGPMASVVGVIHMGVLLTLGLMLSLQFL